MRRRSPSSDQNMNTVVAAGWVGVCLAIIAVIGLLEVPRMQAVWIVILILAALAVPQSFIALRGERKRSERR